jgi:hypothetical protein
LAVDSSAIAVGIQWAETSDCVTAIAGGQSGEDSGSSDFRYSASSMLWQYSWQTPATKGKFLVTVIPPGTGVPEASACVTLK